MISELYINDKNKQTNIIKINKGMEIYRHKFVWIFVNGIIS